MFGTICAFTRSDGVRYSSLAAGHMRRFHEYPDPGAGPRALASTVAFSLDRSRGTVSHIWTRIRIQPATAFVSLSLAFGFAIIFVVPPLRGPDEIAHFLRIYSYTRGEVLPAAAVDGRKGIVVERELYNQLHFFRAGKVGSTQRTEI